jgi:LPS-assembly lipoprotein
MFLSRMLAVACVLPALAACGFQLQGVLTYPAELSAVYLDVPDANSDLAFQLRRSLDAARVELARSAPEATATITVAREDFGRRVKSVSAQNRPTEFEVYYEAEYSVTTAAETLVPRETLSRTRIFPYSERDILGKQQEEDLLRDALARETACVLAHRLAELGH